MEIRRDRYLERLIAYMCSQLSQFPLQRNDYRRSVRW